MNDLERLIAVEAIKQTKARYFRFLDTKDWAGYTSVFTTDAQMDMREETRDENNVINGNQNIADYASKSVEGIVTVHHGYMPEIEFVSDTSANVIWAMEDKLWKPEGSSSSLPFNFLHGYGHYRETYRRVGAQWLIQSLKLTRLRVDFN
jgi:hypothetical protein